MATTTTKSPVLNAGVRNVRGTSASKRLRKAGQLPAILYGRGKKSVSLSVSEHDLQSLVRHGAHGLIQLQIDGKNQNVLIKEMQWDTFGEQVLHVDFIRVARGEMVTIEIPITLRGEAPGVIEGGVLAQRVYELEIDCPVEAIPEEIEINLNNLHLGEEITVADLNMPENCHVHHEPHEEDEEGGMDPMEQVVVEVTHPIEEPEEEEETVVTGAAEPELISEKKEDEEESGEGS